MAKNEFNGQTISEGLNKLEKISDWFGEQEQIVLEEGLKKVKEGAALIEDLKKRLTKVEEEFAEIKKQISHE